MAPSRWWVNYSGWWRSLTHIHVLDRVGDTVLFRMGSPAVYSGWFGQGGPEVSVPRLTSALKEFAGLSDVAGQPELTDYSLLTTEMDIINAERRAFGDSLVEWPLYGVTPEAFQGACAKLGVDACPVSMQPKDLPTEAVRALAKNYESWAVDDLPAKVEALHKRLNAEKGQDGKQHFMFFHCMCGCDRTGQLAAAYSMRYLNKSLTEALWEGERAAERHLYYDFQVGAQWYCESLRAQGLYKHDDCGNCGPFRCEDTGPPMDGSFKADLEAIAIALITGLVMCCCCCRRRRVSASEYRELGEDTERSRRYHITLY